jgi:hypothetical protein
MRCCSANALRFSDRAEIHFLLGRVFSDMCGKAANSAPVFSRSASYLAVGLSEYLIEREFQV